MFLKIRLYFIYESGTIEWVGGYAGDDRGDMGGDTGGQRGSRALWCQQFKGHSVHAPRNFLKIIAYTFYYVYVKKKIVYYINRSTEKKSVVVIITVEVGRAIL